MDDYLVRDDLHIENAPQFRPPERLRSGICAAVLGASALLAGNAHAQSVQPPDDQDDPRALIDFYVPKSMLQNARDVATGVTGRVVQWSGPYMRPQPNFFRQLAGELVSVYPRAVLPANGESVFATLGDEELWKAMQDIGITLMHPVAFEQAGQVTGREVGPSVDGGFDRIALQPAPALGTLEEVQELVNVAANYGGTLAGDIIPLHTGKGYDFRLATMNYRDYPGIYDIIQIPEEHWGLLPEVEDTWGSEVITNDAAQPLLDLGLMPGRFEVTVDDPDSENWSGWSATGEVMGFDGTPRRWIYAHLFKPEQPALNWMDPTYAGRPTSGSSPPPTPTWRRSSPRSWRSMPRRISPSCTASSVAGAGSSSTWKSRSTRSTWSSAPTSATTSSPARRPCIR
jgi:hypothetical protein